MARKKKAICGRRTVLVGLLPLQLAVPSQTEQSIEGQRRDCEAYARAARHDHPCMNMLTGTFQRPRPMNPALAFQQMIADSGKHLFDRRDLLENRPLCPQPL